MSDPAIIKQAAAQRQLDAAIRMLFLHDEDFAAIHTVAAAARGIIRDLAKKSGVDRLVTRRALEDVYREAVAAAVRSVETGELLGEAYQSFLASTAGFVLDEAAANGVRLANINLPADPTKPEIVAALDAKARAIEDDSRIHNHRKRVENFLKHASPKYNARSKAEKRQDTHINAGDVDPISVIVDATHLWLTLSLCPTDEMFVFHQWFCGVTAEQPSEFINTKAGPIHLFTFEQQIEFGRFMLKSVYRRNGRSSERFRDDIEYRVRDGSMYCSLDDTT
jgi:hypothetical protein